MWNGFPRDEVTSEAGARKGSIYAARNGIFTRGILVDMPRLKGVPYLEPGTRIYVDDLEAWEKKAGVKVSAGDALFVRTGRWTRRATVGPWNAAREAAGLDAYGHSRGSASATWPSWAVRRRRTRCLLRKGPK